jgi:hypothetical protein
MGASAFVLSAILSGWEAFHAWHETHLVPNPFLLVDEPMTPIPSVPVTDPSETFAKLP